MRIQNAHKYLKHLTFRFTEYNEGFFLNNQLVKNKKQISSFSSLDEAECFINHLHIMDLFQHNAHLSHEPFFNINHPDFITGIKIGLEIVIKLKLSLIKKYKNINFRIYYTIHDNPIVRFHKVRSNNFYWIDPNSDLFKEDGGMIIETGSCK